MLSYPWSALGINLWLIHPMSFDLWIKNSRILSDLKKLVEFLDVFIPGMACSKPISMTRWPNTVGSQAIL